MTISKGRALSATVNSATSLIKSSIDGTVTTTTLEQSAQQYANAAALPSVGNTFGEMALVQSTNRMYVWNGSGWYNVALINTNPVFTTSPAASYEFDGDSPRNNITITVAASDPESLGVSFSFETGGSMDSMASVTQDSSVFTLVPKGNDSLTDGVTLTGSLTIKATDGVNIVPAVSSFTLTFVTVIQNTAETQILMKATGTGNNSTYDDKSTSNHTITAYGQHEQMAFSPYRESGYSMEFDGSDDYLSYPNVADFQFGTGDFTLEAWVYPTSIPGGGVNNDMTIFGHFGSPTMFFYLSNDTLQPVLWNGSASHGSSLTAKLNGWTHIAFVRQSSTLKTYVNGQLGGTTNSYTTNFNSSTAPYTGKNNSGSNRYFHGYIADLRVVKGTAVYTSEFDPPTEKLTAVANTKLLMGGPGFKDSIPGITWNHHPTVSGPVMRAFAPYDISGAYTTATRGGSVLLAPQAGNDYFTATSSSDFAFGTGDFTVEVWMYPLNVSVHQMIMDTCTPGATGGTAGRIALYLNPNKMAVYRPGTGTTTATGSQTITVGQWHHLAWVRTSGTIKMFMDGEETHSYSDTYNFTLQTLTLGRDAASGGAGQARAIWSDLRIVKGTAVYTAAFDPPTAPLTAITNTTLHLPFTDSKIFDASQGVGPKAGDVQTIVTIGDGAVASSGQQHFSENTIYFDGSNDYVDINQPIEGLEDHTHEAWVYPTGGDATYKGFWSSVTATSGAGINVSKDLAGGPANTSPALVSFSPVVPDNEWSHVVLQRQSGVHALYRNGVLQGTSTNTVNFNTTTIRLASRYSNNSTWSLGGYMHDFRISKGLSRYPYISKPVTLTSTNSGMEKPDGTTPTATGSNTKLLAYTTSTTTADASASSHTLTASGSVSASTGPATGMHSAYFANGDADLITIPASADHQIYGGDYTVEAWLKPTNFNASYNYFISKGGNSTREWGFSISASNIIVYWSQNGSNDQTIIKTVTNKLSEWMHVAFTKSGNTITIFKNGQTIGSGTFNSIYSGNGVTTMGRLWQYTGISHSYDGYISNLRIIKGQAIYSANFTPSTTALSG